MVVPEKLKKLKHLYARAGFGISYSELNKIADQPVDKAVKQLFADAEKLEPISISEEYLPYSGGRKFAQLNEQERKDLIRKARMGVRFLNSSWIEKMGSSKSSLREKMTLFWHGHFACRSVNPSFLQQLNNIHRKHALGNFRTLLLEVSRSPAMLQFLNNQQNRKGKPNENFARELMELFTLGRGNYSEKDIKEAARAFTGWSFMPGGEFLFREKQHDYAEKTFFSQTGNFNGTDIIDIILKKPETATFIARKLYLFFVSDTENDQHIQELGKSFYESDYDIAILMKKLLSSDWFYSDQVIGSKIKSPVELLVGLNKLFHVTYKNPAVQIQFQSAMGQVLFYPPNVAGWAAGKSWIDSSSLMLRLKLPSLILNAGIIDFEGKADIEDEALLAMMQIKMKSVERRIQSVTDWDKFLSAFPSGFNTADLASFLLQTPVKPEIMKLLETNSSLKSAALELVSMPEYQLC
ncbi:DUF1800 domain-containing protein [Daejeonella oryzae]|uniref:DUF1800 domain-containing protein n=1 Tax=Daejeonella oryzae TaxID=1122943 RepID=UPI00041B580B|nr:DUF1800 domain-containing protein [Daejeonella oryzae]